MKLNIDISEQLYKRVLKLQKAMKKEGKNVTVNKIINSFLNSSLPKIKDIKQEKIELTELNFPKEYIGLDELGLCVIRAKKFKCPFDNTEFIAPVPTYRSYISDTDDFGNIKYIKAINNKYKFIDHSLHNIKVCPNCLYSSDINGFFIKENNYSNSKKGWKKPEYFNDIDIYILNIINTVDQRLKIVNNNKLLFSVNRQIKEALISLELAINSFDILLDNTNIKDIDILRFKKGSFHILKYSFNKDKSELERSIEIFKHTEISYLNLDHLILLYSQMFQAAKILGLKEEMKFSYNKMFNIYSNYVLNSKSSYTAKQKKIIKKAYEIVSDQFSQ